MKKIIYTLACFLFFCLILIFIMDIKPERVFQWKEIIFVLITGIVLTIPSLFDKDKKKSDIFKNQSIVSFINKLGRNTIITGSFTSLLLILTVTSNPVEITSTDEITIYILVALLESSRPFIYGMIFNLILSVIKPVSENEETVTTPDSITESTTDLTQDVAKCTFNVVDSVHSMTKITLSRREKEVATLVIQGLSNMEIAEELFISVETVKRHISTIFEKCNVSSRKELREILQKCAF